MKKNLLWPIIIIAVVAGCTKSETAGSPSPPPVEPSTSIPSQEATTPTAPPQSWKAFRMPSGSIGCISFGSGLRCDILSGMNPKPAGRCELDWTGLSIEATGRPSPVCAGDTAYDVHAQVLAYGQTWERGGIMCDSQGSGLSCTNREGHSFTLSRETWTTT